MLIADLNKSQSNRYDDARSVGIETLSKYRWYADFAKYKEISKKEFYTVLNKAMQIIREDIERFSE